MKHLPRIKFRTHKRGVQETVQRLNFLPALLNNVVCTSQSQSKRPKTNGKSVKEPRTMSVLHILMDDFKKFVSIYHALKNIWFNVKSIIKIGTHPEVDC